MVRQVMIVIRFDIVFCNQLGSTGNQLVTLPPNIRPRMMTLTKCVTHLAGTKYLGGYFLAYMWNIFKNTHITLKKKTPWLQKQHYWVVVKMCMHDSIH